MRKYIYTGIMMLSALSLSGCYDDDSTLGDMSRVNTIEIEEMPAVSVVSFCGNRLNITPKIDTRLGDGDMSYAWYLVRPEGSTSVADVKNYDFRQEKISDKKTLDYEVNLSSGTYKFVFEATDTKTGLSAIQTMTVNTATEFSQGFYILKDMGNGTSDIDLTAGDVKMYNLLEKLSGAPMHGNATNMAVGYCQCYIDDDTQKMSYTTMLNLFTDKDYAAYRTEDMKKIFDKSNISFEDWSNTQCYNLISLSYTTAMTTSQGLHGTVAGSDFSSGSGKYGFAVAEGASKFFQPMWSTMSNTYWNNDSHSIYTVDINCSSAYPMDYDTSGMDITNQECIASGYYVLASGWDPCSETNYYLTEDKTDSQRYLYLADSETQTVEVVKLDKNLHISKAVSTTNNALDATIIYCVDAGKVYAYNWVSNTEYEVSMPGIANGETINFITYQYVNLGAFGDPERCFTKLVVGTQSGSKYKLYFYDGLVGGIPLENAVETIEGTGIVKCVRFVSATPVVDSMASFSGLYSGNLTPCSD